MQEAPPERPAEARRKEQTKQTADGLVVHSFRTLLASLGTLVKNQVVPHGGDGSAAFDLLTQPTALQNRAYALLGLPLPRFTTYSLA